MKITEREKGILEALWPKFFPSVEEINITPHDHRVKLCMKFLELFSPGGEAEKLVENVTFCQEGSCYFSVPQTSNVLPFQDFSETLRTRPNELIGAIGLSTTIL